MAKEAIKTKKSFGTATVDHFSPARQETWPKAINIHLSFEEAVRLHLGLQHALLELNNVNRATTAGCRTAVNLCVHTEARRVTIDAGRILTGESDPGLADGSLRQAGGELGAQDSVENNLDSAPHPIYSVRMFTTELQTVWPAQRSISSKETKTDALNPE